MRAVVDTNVLAYLLLGTEGFAQECSDFVTALDEAWAPAIWEAELANVFWMAARQGVLSIEDASRRLILADGLAIHTVPNRMLWQGALVRAFASKVAVSDTLFVELAVREHVPLATFDRAVIEAFPAVAAHPGDLIPRAE